MTFALIEHLNGISTEIILIARILSESLDNNESERMIIETAEGVLSQFYNMLKTGGKFTPQEAEDHAQIMAGLSHLMVDDNRQRYPHKINISTPEGQEKFKNVIDHVGESKPITGQVRRIATEDAAGEYKRNLRKIEQFRQLSPSQQQDFMVEVNKLRLAYKKLRDEMDTKKD